MVERFIEEYAKLIVSEPDLIRIERSQIEEHFVEITIRASSQDAGRLIGKDGKMIGAIKTLISGCKAKDGTAYRVVVKSL